MRTKESKKRSTATKHAESEEVAMRPCKRRRGSATEHAEQSITWRDNAEIEQHLEEAQADRANDTLEHLAFTLAQFLTYVLREVCHSPRLQVECEDIVFDKIAEWA